MATGIIALSYGKHAKEPSPVNVKLARIVDTLNDEAWSVGEPTLTVVQWEVAKGMFTRPNLVVEQQDATNLDRNGKPYLDSQDVLNKAFEAFRAADITEVAVVAHQFFHRQVVEVMVRRAGFKIAGYHAPFVGFDKSRLNLQWWCRGPIRFVTYLGLQVIGKVTGKNLHGIGEKPHPH